MPVLTSTSTLRKAGSELVPGIRLMVPAQGQRNFAPEAYDDFQISNMTLYGALAAAFPATFQGMFDDIRWINDPNALTYIPPVAGLLASPAKAEDVSISKQSADDIPDVGEAVDNVSGIL